MRKQFSIASGFSLVELMVAIGIIGILAAIAVPRFEDYRCCAKNLDSIDFQRNLKAYLASLDEDDPATKSDAVLNYMASVLQDYRARNKDPTINHCNLSDLNGDGKSTAVDIALFNDFFGMSFSNAVPGYVHPINDILEKGTEAKYWPPDYNGDGSVNGMDLGILRACRSDGSQCRR